MGGSSKFDFVKRSAKAESLGYSKAFSAPETVFTQQKERKAHESMLSQNAKLRESRDNEVFPNTLPIILGLDVTGSMGDLPKFLVTEGLPKIMGKLTQRGLDPALLFTAIGDHEYDKYPFQVGQFESSDEELDLWLTRTYLEGGGGSNSGESYLLEWYFAAKQTVTDNWYKRRNKSILITIGDEPDLVHLPASAIKEVFGADDKAYTHEDLLKMAQEKWNVFHIHVNHGSGHRSSLAINQWRQLLGQNFIEVDNVNAVADKIIELVVQHNEGQSAGSGGVIPTITPSTGNTDSSVTML